jgi:hypothetical protein
MKRDFGHRDFFRDRGRSKAMVAGAILVVLLLGAAAGCGGGSSGMPGGGGPPPPPSFTNIDAPGAGTTSPEGTFGVGVSANDNVIGYIIDAAGVFHGFVRTSVDQFATIDAPGAALTQNNGTLITAMNASGVSVGYYSDGQFLHSFLVSSSGTMTEFDPPNSSGSTALCINDGGVIAGAVIDLNGNHAYVRSASGTFTLIDPTGSPSGIQAALAYGINASGGVTGEFTDANSVHHGFLRDAGGNVTLLDAPGAGTAANEGTEPVAINANGAIVGGINVGVINGVNTTHSVIRAADGTYTVFDPPQSGAHTSFAKAINDNGVVVGEYRDANLVRHGYLRQPDGTFTSFDDPDAAQLPLSNTNLGTIPRSINANGAVAGLYSDANGVRHAFIWQ